MKNHYSPGVRNSHQMALKTDGNKAGDEIKGTFLETFFSPMSLNVPTNRGASGLRLISCQSIRPSQCKSDY